MEPIRFFQIASKQAEWLSVRESVVSTNIANVNTPGFRAKDITPFSSMLDKSGTRVSGADMSMASTNPLHLGGMDRESFSSDIKEDPTSSVKITASGNNVSITQELMKSMEVRQDYDLNTGLVKSLNKMMLEVVRK